MRELLFLLFFFFLLPLSILSTHYVVTLVAKIPYAHCKINKKSEPNPSSAGQATPPSFRLPGKLPSQCMHHIPTDRRPIGGGRYPYVWIVAPLPTWIPPGPSTNEGGAYIVVSSTSKTRKESQGWRSRTLQLNWLQLKPGIQYIITRNFSP